MDVYRTSSTSEDLSDRVRNIELSRKEGHVIDFKSSIYSILTGIVTAGALLPMELLPEEPYIRSPELLIGIPIATSALSFLVYNKYFTNRKLRKKRLEASPSENSQE